MSIQVMMQMLGQGFLVSLQLFVLTLLGSIPLGIPVAFMRMSKIAPLRWIARIYISVMRGTPLMLQMFAIYFAPYYVFGISLTPDSKWTACVVAFIINYAGYFAEIYRSGLQSIPRGQYEAAEVLGYSRMQTFLYIVMPQVAKRILPAMGNENKVPCELSGGQQQRVSIARALALDPEILFFDEPTSALDPELTAEVLRVIKDLAAQNMTMVIVTHAMQFARDVADRVVFMDGGRIVEEGPADQVIGHPHEQRTREFLSRIEG